MAKKFTEQTHEVIPFIKTTGGKTFDGKPSKSGGYAMRGASNIDLANEIADLKTKGITATVDMRPVKLQPGESRAGDSARKGSPIVKPSSAKATPAKPAAKPKPKAVPKTRQDGKPFSSASARGAKPTPAPRTKNNPNGELRPKKA